jgi:hypothetical protein
MEVAAISRVSEKGSIKEADRLAVEVRLNNNPGNNIQ